MKFQKLLKKQLNKLGSKTDPRGRCSQQRCSVKKVFLEISQNSQENTSARESFLIKLQAVLGLIP